jgi:hypothetical protein
LGFDNVDVVDIIDNVGGTARERAAQDWMLMGGFGRWLISVFSFQFSAFQSAAQSIAASGFTSAV